MKIYGSVPVANYPLASDSLPLNCYWCSALSGAPKSPNQRPVVTNRNEQTILVVETYSYLQIFLILQTFSEWNLMRG